MYTFFMRLRINLSFGELRINLLCFESKKFIEGMMWVPVKEKVLI